MKEMQPTFWEESQASTKAWTVNLPIQGFQIVFEIDSGADTSVMPSETFEKLAFKPKLKNPTNKLESPGGKLNCMSYFIVTTMRKGKRFRFKVNVIKGPRCSHLVSCNVVEEIRASAQISDLP